MPAIEIETVQPLYRPTEDDVLFLQLNARSREWNETYNLGLGFRSIVNDRLMLGVNAFYDYTDYHDHMRYGFGLEALGKKYEARANSYFKASGEKDAKDDSKEKVMGGFDVEIGGSLIPFYEDLRLFAGYGWFNSTYADDVKRLSLRGTLPISRYMGLEFKYTRNCCNDWAKTSSSGQVDTLFAKVSIGLDGPIKGVARTEEDFRKKLLQPVERENTIIVERKAGAGAFSVTVSRGT